jgi:hypothetical protein
MLRKKAIITLPAKKQEPIHEEELSQEILTQKSPEYTPASPEPEQKKPRLILKRKLAIIPEEKEKEKETTPVKEKEKKIEDEKINLEDDSDTEEEEQCMDQLEDGQIEEQPEKPKRTNVPICHVHELNCQISKTITVLQMLKRVSGNANLSDVDSLIKVWQSEQDRWGKVEKNHKVASERKKRIKLNKESIDVDKISSEVKCHLKHNHCKVK